MILEREIPDFTQLSLTNQSKWSSIEEVSYPGGDEKDDYPCMIEFNSKLYVIWATWGDEFSTGTDWDIVVREYDETGWSSIYEITYPTDTGSDVRPNAIEYDDKLYVVWATTDPSISDEIDYDIVIRSFDGSSWSSISEVTLPGDTGSPQMDYRPKLGVYDGDLYVAWDSNDNTTTDGIDRDIVIRSFDGSTWGSITELTPAINIGTDYSPVLESYDGKLYVIWYTYDTSEVTGNGNVVLKTYDGISWSSLFHVSESPYNSISLNPDAIVYNDRLYIVWRGINYILARYYDGAWSSIEHCVDCINLNQELENPKITEYNNKLYVTYEIAANVSTNQNIALIEYDGISWSNHINLSYESNLGDDSKPVISNYNEQLFVCWFSNELDLGDGTDYDIVIRDFDEMAPQFSGVYQATDLGTGGNVSLTWDIASDLATPITYQVYISEQSGMFDFNAPHYTTSDLTCLVSNLTNGQKYFFIVRAKDSRGNMEINFVQQEAVPTTSVDVVPPSFQGIKNAINLDIDGNVFLNWNEAIDSNTTESNSDPSLPITYNGYVSNNSTQQNYSIPYFTTNDLNTTISGLENGQEYFFVVRAEDSQGNEENNTIEKSVMPTTPVDDTTPSFSGLANAIDTCQGGTIYMNWSEATDPDLISCSGDPSVPISYNIYMSNVSGAQNYAQPVNTTNDLNYTITGLNNNQTYFFVVRAQDASNNEENNTIERSVIPTAPPIENNTNVSINITDNDNDDIPDSDDPDDDNDGVPDTEDDFPFDPDETIDTDNDGTGNNADDDDDGDSVPDTEDAFPLDPNETIDTDGDGIGNNADNDDDGDGVIDEDDYEPLNPDVQYKNNSFWGILIFVVSLLVLIVLVYQVKID